MANNILKNINGLSNRLSKERNSLRKRRNTTRIKHSSLGAQVIFYSTIIGLFFILSISSLGSFAQASIRDVDVPNERETDQMVPKLEGYSFTWEIQKSFGVFAYQAFHTKDEVKLTVRTVDIASSYYSCNISKSSWINSTWQNEDFAINSSYYIVPKDWGQAAANVIESELKYYWYKHPLIISDYYSKSGQVEGYNEDFITLIHLVNNTWKIPDVWIPVDEVLSVSVFPTGPEVGDLAGFQFNVTDGYFINLTSSTISFPTGVVKIQREGSNEINYTIQSNDTVGITAKWSESVWPQVYLNYHAQYDFRYFEENQLLDYVDRKLIRDYTTITYDTEWYHGNYITTVLIKIQLDDRNYDYLKYSRQEGLLLERETSVHIENGTALNIPLTGSLKLTLSDLGGYYLAVSPWHYVIYIVSIFAGVVVIIIIISVLINRRQRKLLELDY